MSDSRAHSIDIRMMARAIQLARQGQYWAAPNPSVGCVLVRSDTSCVNGHEEIIGEGFTQPAGGNHAEVEALRQVGRGGNENASGATAYVTLEPCSHTGMTGPCADALIEAGISRVVAAMEDPNPQVSGQGFERLRAAGIVVDVGLLEAQARAVIPGFVSRMSCGRGRVRAKLAMSLDGRTAMASGESQWITGAAARADVQRLRARSCAIVTGVGTVLNDNCSLTVRPDELDLPAADTSRATAHQPLRVILDSSLQTPATAKVLDGTAPTILCHNNSVCVPAPILACGVDRLPLELGASGLDLDQLMGYLSARQCNEILVESGPRLAGALLQAGLLDELIVYMAPTFMGSSARPLLELPLDTMADKVQLDIQDVRKVGQDWRFTVVPT